MSLEPEAGAVAAPDAKFSKPAIAWRALLLAGLVVVTVPPWFSQIDVGLDPSWIIGLHLAGIKGLVFGRDVAFTYGPLGFALQPKSLGTLDLHATAIRLTLHLCWWTSAAALLFRTRGYATPLVFVAATAVCGAGLDMEPNFALNGVVILSVLNFLLLAELDRKPAWAVPGAILAAAALLAKFNLGVACAGSLGVWSLMRLARDPSRRVVGRLALLGLAYVGTVVGLFLIYGGPISALWPFLKASKEIAAGYGTQMAIDDPASTGLWTAVALFAATAAGLVVAAAARSPMAPALALMIAPMFILYKGAAVRHDLGHYLISWPGMVSMTALVLPAASRALRTRIPATVAVAGVVGLSLWYAPTSLEKITTRGPSNLAALWRLDEFRAAARARDGRLKAEQALPPRFLERIGAATVDVYPWEISLAWSNDLNWRPRPVFQSYSTYTPALDMMGVRHYRGPRAPRFVIYSHVAIDMGVPCAVDSRTWIELYRWYDLVDAEGDKLLLERRATPKWSGARPIDRTTVDFARTYAIPPAAGGLVFLKADLELSLWGRIKALLYKVDPPLIRVEYKNGGAATYRMVWRNAVGGFVASNMPYDLDAAIQMFRGGSAAEVAGVSFDDPNGCFKPRVELQALQSGPLAEPIASADGTTVR